MKFAELSVGMKDSLTKKFTDQDIRDFARVSLDTNPIHVDEEAAKKSIFGRRIAHGMLVSGLISAVLANKLPGAGTIYLGQDSSFLSPVFLDDTITATCEVIELREDKKIVKLSTDCFNQEGKQVIKGTAVVKLTA